MGNVGWLIKEPPSWCQVILGWYDLIYYCHYFPGTRYLAPASISKCQVLGYCQYSCTRYLALPASGSWYLAPTIQVSGTWLLPVSRYQVFGSCQYLGTRYLAANTYELVVQEGKISNKIGKTPGTAYWPAIMNSLPLWQKQHSSQFNSWPDSVAMMLVAV